MELIFPPSIQVHTATAVILSLLKNSKLGSECEDKRNVAGVIVAPCRCTSSLQGLKGQTATRHVQSCLSDFWHFVMSGMILTRQRHESNIILIFCGCKLSHNKVHPWNRTKEKIYKVLLSL